MDEYNIDLSNTEKIVLIGDQLITDIMFGNLNKMVTIWVTEYRNEMRKIVSRNQKEIYLYQRNL